MSKKLPIIAQSIVYRRKGASFEVLLLKRNHDRGGFWNVVNGTLEFGESILDCRSRELVEEADIHSVLHWSDELYRFTFIYKDQPMTVVVFSAEVSEEQQVVINEEHTEYRWVSFGEAHHMLQFDDDKKALKICQEQVEASAARHLF